jgi:dynein heavy chain
VWTQIKDELHQSCTKSLELFLKANGFGKDKEKEDTKSGDDTAREATDRDEEANGMTYTERATTRTQCRKLTKFIRMVQYLFNDAIAVMVRHTTQKLLELLDGYAEEEEAEHEGEVHASKGGGHGAHDEKRRGGNNKPKFVIECLLEAHGLRFQPPGKDVRECIETCLRDGLHAVSGMPAFLHVDDFSPFTKPLAELGDVLQLEEQQSDLYGLVHQDPKYKELMKKIGIRFEGLFDRVVQYADGYRHFVDIYTENQALQDCSVTFAEATLEDFRTALGKYRKQTEDIKAMGRSKDIGLFRLDSKRMQDTLLPSPMRCNDLLATYVPELAMQRNEELSTEIKAHNDRLSQYPNNVDEYVEFNIHLAKVDTDMPSLSKRYDEIQEMAEIIREYGIRVDNDTRKAFSDLAASHKQMVMQLAEGKQQSETNVTHFSKALENDIPELHKRVDEAKTKLEHADFSDVSKMKGDARKEVLKMLDELEADVTKANEDGQRFNRYQDVLKVEPTPFDDVDDLKLVFQGRAKLWRNMESWDELSEGWMKTSFGSVQPEAMQKRVAEYNKIAVQSQKAMPNSQVPNIWFDTVKKFKDTLPVVVDLRNKALEDRHWETITGLIGKKLDLDDENFTLGDLLEMGVDQHMDAIHETSVNASK